MKTVAVVGGGPAGLMAAEVLSREGIRVVVFEAKPSVGRKFLVAGKGGLNLTHSEPLDAFVSRYGAQQKKIGSLLNQFSPSDVQEWCHGLGVKTFVGKSRRIFPEDLKALPLLNAWLQRLRNQQVEFRTRHRWSGWDSSGGLQFETPNGTDLFNPDAVILAMGGASWPKLGSDGNWVSVLRERGIPITSLKPSNCGFDVGWSEFFRDRFAGQPIKSVVLKFTASDGRTFHRQGACMVSSTGLEGSLIYAASALIRDEIAAHGMAQVQFDFAPDRTLEDLTQRLSAPRGSRSIASHLRTKAKIKGVEAGLLREFAADQMNDPGPLATAIKNLSVPLKAARPIEEAISSAGGVCFESLNDDLMVESCHGLFCVGEMLDWEAPTGGYLLTACFASGVVAARGVLRLG